MDDRLSQMYNRMEWYFPNLPIHVVKEIISKNSKNCFGIRPHTGPDEVWDLILFDASSKECKVLEVTKTNREITITNHPEKFTSLLHLICVAPVLKHYSAPKSGFANTNNTTLNYSRKYSLKSTQDSVNDLLAQNPTTSDVVSENSDRARPTIIDFFDSSPRRQVPNDDGPLAMLATVDTSQIFENSSTQENPPTSSQSTPRSFLIHDNDNNSHNNNSHNNNGHNIINDNNNNINDNNNNINDNNNNINDNNNNINDNNNNNGIDDNHSHRPQNNSNNNNNRILEARPSNSDARYSVPNTTSTKDDAPSTTALSKSTPDPNHKRSSSQASPKHTAREKTHSGPLERGEEPRKSRSFFYKGLTGIFSASPSGDSKRKTHELDRQLTLKEHQKKNFTQELQFTGKHAHRNFAIQELYGTELEFCFDLTNIVKYLCAPLAKIVSQQTLNILFPEFVEVLKFSNQLSLRLSKLKLEDYMQSEELLEIAPYYKEVMGGFEVFAESCSYQGLSVWLYHWLIKRSKKFKEGIERLISNPLFRKLPFDSLAIKPMHRITKYPLLLSAIIDKTPSETEEHQSLVQINSFIIKIVEKINCTQNQYQKVIDLIQTLAPMGLQQMVLSARTLDADAVFTKISSSNFSKDIPNRLVLACKTLFILLAKEKGHFNVLEYSIPLDELFLLTSAAIRAPDSNDDLKLHAHFLSTHQRTIKRHSHFLVLFHLPRKKYFFYATDTPEFLDTWVQAFQTLQSQLEKE